MSETKLTTIEHGLLSSLMGGSKFLDMGRSPVGAIAVAWDFADRGLVRLNGSSGEIAITDEGRAALSRATPSPEDASS
jgi:hypothetical protein